MSGEIFHFNNFWINTSGVSDFYDPRQRILSDIKVQNLSFFCCQGSNDGMKTINNNYIR